MRILFLLAILFSSCSEEKDVYFFSYFKGNGEDGLHLAYSYDAYKWKTLKNDNSFLKPEVGESILMRDPCIIKGPDGLFHMVWTPGWNEKGIGYANSKDLENWSKQLYIPVMAHEKGCLNSWAPEINYDEASQQYMIYWSTTIPGRFPETDDQGDSRYNHRMYYVTTKDFKTFSDTKLLYDKGFNVIDGTIKKYDEEYVMFLKDETRYPKPEKNIRIAKANSITGEYSKASYPITGDYWAEGPTVLKKDGKTIVYFDKYANHKYGAVESMDLKTWEDVSNKIEFPKGTRHGTVFKVKESFAKKFIELYK
jgi:hypothetical protein